MFKPISSKVNFPSLERKILKWWYEDGIVEKYLHKNDSSFQHFSFLDGPITANNPMGVHHGWGRTYKDLWQRFFNMRGYKQRFQNGFDCQGLWVEVEVEKELAIKSKKDIENLIPGHRKKSIEKFVDLCKARVNKYAQIQTEQSKRLGYFMDWDNSYYTMSDENNYMIWHFLKVCHQKGWIYKGRDSVPWCPRCETAISQHEMLTEDYREVKHESVFFRLPITSSGFHNTSFLIWTTTPWTIPANVAVAINPDFVYQGYQNQTTGEILIILKKDQIKSSDKEKAAEYKRFIENILTNLGKKEGYKKTRIYQGSQLVGLRYMSPYDDFPRVTEARAQNPDTFHTVVEAKDYVVATKGTGLLHVATGCGTEDFRIGKEKNLPVLSVIDDQANYLKGLGKFTSKNAKKHPQLILNDLKTREGGKYFLKTEMVTHRYPTCWRCKRELVWKVTDEWYIAMDKPAKSKVKSPAKGEARQRRQKSKVNKTLRERMIKVAKKIKWIPEFGLERELDWLSNMDDWLISKKNRYWGLALPIWQCHKCGSFEVIGSKEELKKKAVAGWQQFKGKSPHKPQIDELKIPCSKCKEIISRIEPVGNPWLDAGVVSFSTLVDISEGKVSYTTDKKYWKKWFPADFITESFPGQFKNWFYSLIAMSTVLENTNPFKTVLGFASLLGEDGRPMHKSWGNSIDFQDGAEKIGVDVMRWMYVTQNPVVNLLFGYKRADETRRKLHLPLWNIYNFFITYANIDKVKSQKSKVKSQNSHLTVLDKWLLSKLNRLIATVTESLEKYDAYTASLSIQDFVTDFSTWYIRRSRDRIGPGAKDEKDKAVFYSVAYSILISLIKLLAPFMPFMTEEIFKNLTNEESVHLSSWPEVNRKLINMEIEEVMSKIRQVVENGHAQRKKERIKVRQPLKKLKVRSEKLKVDKEYIQLIKDELNVKEVEIKEGKGEIKVKLDTTLTTELIEEGEAREIVRKVQLWRKRQGFSPADKVCLTLPSWPKDYTEYIKKKTLAIDITYGKKLQLIRV